MKKTKSIPCFADGTIDAEQLRAHVNWEQLSEMERIILTVTEWNWERLTDEVKDNPSLATLKWDGGENLLCIAAHDNQLVLTNLLLEYGADPNDKDSSGTALYCAVWSGNIEIVKLLVENGALVNGKSVHGCAPLNLALQKGYTDIANFLVSRGANADNIDSG